MSHELWPKAGHAPLAIDEIIQRLRDSFALWKNGERPQLKTSVLEGDVGLSI